MSALCPSPKCPVNLTVDVCKNLLADDMSMVVSPSLNNRIEFHYQTISRSVSTFCLDNSLNLVEKCSLAFGRRFDKEFAVVLADVLAEKIEAIIDMGDGRLLRREREIPFLEKGLHERHHFILKDFFRDTSYHKVG